MLKVLVELAEDCKEPPDVRRKAAKDVLHEGWGPPPTSQEVVRPALMQVNQVNFGAQPGAALTPAQAYAAMVSGVLPLDPSLIEAQPAVDDTRKSP